MARDDRADRVRGVLLRFGPAFVIALGIAGSLALGLNQHFTFEQALALRQWVGVFASENPIVAALLYLALYAFAVTLAFPVTWLLTIIGSAIFGLLAGGLLTAAGATLGATLLFLAARTAFADALRRRADGVVARVSAGFERNAFSYLLALRLAPVFPFSVINVVPALFAVSTRIYVGATFLGILPGTFVYAAIGAGLDDIVARAAAENRMPGPGDLISPAMTLGLLGLAGLALVPAIFRWFSSRRQVV